jgi:hypothetical protein
MLEALARTLPLADEAGLRAALYLARDHGREDMREALVVAATGGKREEFRGMAAAALWDASPATMSGAEATRMQAVAVADELFGSRSMANVAWAVLIRAAARGGAGTKPLLSETLYRWIQWGWLE